MLVTAGGSLLCMVDEVAKLTGYKPPEEATPTPIHPSAGPYILKVMLLPFTVQDTVQLVPRKVW